MLRPRRSEGSNPWTHEHRRTNTRSTWIRRRETPTESREICQRKTSTRPPTILETPPGRVTRRGDHYSIFREPPSSHLSEQDTNHNKTQKSMKKRSPSAGKGWDPRHLHGPTTDEVDRRPHRRDARETLAKGSSFLLLLSGQDYTTQAWSWTMCCDYEPKIAWKFEKVHVLRCC